MKKSQTKSKKPVKSIRSPCPVANMLDILGDKWTLLVIRDMMMGKSTYSELQNSFEKIPTNILAERLKRLQQAQIITREQYQDRPPRYAYHLTDRGRALRPVMKEIAKWGLKYLPDTAVHPSFRE